MLRSYGRIRRDPKVITVDVDQSHARAALPAVDPGFEREIVLVEADVRDPATSRTVAGLVPEGARCFVIEDSAHTWASTAAALRGFARFVPPKGFLVVEDGCVDVEVMRVDPDWPRGVLPALDDWLTTPEGSAFTVRREFEFYGISCHPCGFLQRRAAPSQPS